jgi:hypothetical protein
MQFASCFALLVPPPKHANKCPGCFAMQSLQNMLTGRSKLGIKRMGEVDWKPFGDICSQKFPGEDWAKISAELCSEWQEKLKNPHWHPFKKVMENGEPQVCSYTYTF